MIIHKTIPIKGLFPTLPADVDQTILDAVFEEIDVVITIENYYPGCPAVIKADPLDSSPGEDAEYDATPLENYGSRFLSELFDEAATNPGLARALTCYRSGQNDVVSIIYHGVNDAIANLDLADDILQWEIEAKSEAAEYRADCEEEMKRW
jgi:hypothetical protein